MPLPLIGSGKIGRGVNETTLVLAVHVWMGARGVCLDWHLRSCALELAVSESLTSKTNGDLWQQAWDWVQQNVVDIGAMKIAREAYMAGLRAAPETLPQPSVHASLVREIAERHDRASKLLWGPASLPGMMLGPMDSERAHADRGALLSLLTPEQRGELKANPSPVCGYPDCGCSDQTNCATDSQRLNQEVTHVVAISMAASEPLRRRNPALIEHAGSIPAPVGEQVDAAGSGTGGLTVPSSLDLETPCVCGALASECGEDLGGGWGLCCPDCIHKKDRIE